METLSMNDTTMASAAHPKVMHVITGLNQGGAEGVLLRLIAGTQDAYKHTVVSLIGDGIVGPKIRALGVRVVTLDMPRGRLTLKGLWRLQREIKHASPDVIQSWMFHADLVAGLVARVAGNPPVVWGIRHSDLDERSTKKSTRIVASLGARLSGRIPQSVVWNSHEAMLMHLARGYHPRDARVIPNGFDLEQLHPDAAARARVRSEIGVGSSEVLLGDIAHWSPEKDHENLFGAIAILKNRDIRVRCLLAGNGMTQGNQLLTKAIARHGVADDVLLLGFRPDVPDLLNAIDLNVLPSLGGEGFPNSVGEAMACGTPCVVTDVGDAAMIVGDLGWVVPPKNSERLASAIEQAIEVLAHDGATLGAQCRERIAEHFGLAAMCQAFAEVWADMARHRRR
jgi:glycosyltransferase involved in cell wall biosynthesis